MALIIIVVWDTNENERTKYTRDTLRCLLDTVDFTKHRLFISDNGSCEETHILYDWIKKELGNRVTIKYNNENIGTSRALNFGLRSRNEGEACIKIDGDVFIHENGWVDRLCEVIDRDDTYGIVGLKRKDLLQSPNTDNEHFKSEMVMLPQVSGQRWVCVELVADVMGTCTLFSPKLMDAIGFSEQPSLYGFEDVLYGLRSRIAGFKNCFLFWIEIDHIDTGDKPYTQEKQQMAADSWQEYMKWHAEYCDGTRLIYYDGGFSE